MSKTYIRLQEVLIEIPVSRSTIYRWIAAGEFPQPVKLGAKTSAFVLEEFHEWQKKRNEQRSEAAA